MSQQIHQEQGEISSQLNEKDQQHNATLSHQNPSNTEENQLNQQINQKIEVSSPPHQSNYHLESALQKQNQAKHMQTIQLICEDRNNQKKCCFPSIQLEVQDSSNKINVFNLLNSSLSVKSFLKGHLIFVEQEGMDIALGLFPFEMDKSYELPLNLMGGKLSAKIQHLRVQSNKKSQFIHKKSCTSLPEKNSFENNQNKQCRKKESESLIDQEQVLTALNDDTKQEYTSSHRKISSSYSSNNNYCSSYSSEINSQYLHDINEFIEDEEDAEQDNDDDDECMDGIINLGKLKRNRISHTSSSADCSQREKNNKSESKHLCGQPKIIVTDDNCDEEDEYNEGSASSSSKSSFSIKKKIHKDKIQIIKTVSTQQKRQLSQKIKGEEHLIPSFNGENNANCTAQSLSAAEQPKKRRRQTLNKRSHERTIREGILLVTQWRNSHEYYKSKNQVKDLQEVAKDMGISKKTLDYYYLELRTAEFFNFDFDQHLNQRMGFLRQFIEDETKKFQDSNKQAKIPRQLNFKYRLPEHRGNPIVSPSQLAAQNGNNINMPFIKNQQSGHIYLPNDNFGSQNHQMVYSHSNHSHHNHHHHQNMNTFQNNQQNHFSSQIKQNNQSIPIINQQQKLNQILQQQQQQQINTQNANNNNNNQIQQIDANSTSSLSVFNQTTYDNSLNQSDHNFLNSQPTIQHFSAQSQPTQIFHGYPQDSKNNTDNIRIDHTQSQILDYQISNGQNYQNFNIQTNQIQQEDFKPLLQYSEQQQHQSILGDQLNNSILHTQSNNMSRYLSQQNQMIPLPSAHSICDSTSNLTYQPNRLQSQQQMPKQNPDLLHPYEQKQQNEGYKLFLDKQKQLKLQEQLAEECAMQQMFE
ncbi:hypothetical protein TTHERM_00124030 (macronuclear) [Tetrahymena thermophila SB210]|uniref:Uncharacterized protein n=1 Tax=Tetrahymena thermophila (strain SB210) TaxID=312017 RepID=Q22YL8_TETTS|nr:hypothetical protein TTHERM_00124030 [Tetrahymena thermophila SB210]EAR90653.1 hypothetical protein TTHERM_00124030 [Tetrahymena thermophila SB210]|eukprot:XP_001010898.1 hypothetical protein TTHERM_00124030 [Tetrahymena thermophila SB210]